MIQTYAHQKALHESRLDLRYSRFKSYWSNETKFDDRFTIKPAIRAIDFEFPGKKPRTTTISARFLRFSDALVPSPSGSILKRKNAL